MASVLKSVLDGSEKSSLILIKDSTSLNGRPVLKSVINQLSAKFEEIHVILNEVNSVQYKDVSNYSTGKVTFHDYTGDLAGWNGSALNLNTELHSFLSARISQNSSVLVVIDGLSHLVHHQSVNRVCQTLHKLKSINNQEDITVSVLALLHADLHDEHALTLLHHTASSVLTLDVPKQNQFHTLARFIHKKASGKITNISTHICLAKDLVGIETICEYKPLVPIVEATADSSTDPAANLTFNLTLNESERVARSNLKLPYMHQGVDNTSTTGTGKIFYQPDEADDFDEEDPDDDLDI